MKLSRENLSEWKEELDIEFKNQYGVENFSETLSDEQWIDYWDGDEVQDVIDAEVSCWGLRDILL